MSQSNVDPVPRTDTVRAQRAAELIEAGRQFYARGWLPATSGNLSARIGADRIAITVSGTHKGDLDAQGIMVVDLDGRAVGSTARPSAETALHTALYRREPAIGAVLHIHSPNATVLSRVFGNELPLRDYEILKAFAGVDTHETELKVPIFPNDQDIPRLAQRIEEHMTASGPLHGYLIAGHGLYAWGRSVAEARRHVEALEFLFDCEMNLYRMGRT